MLFAIGVANGARLSRESSFIFMSYGLSKGLLKLLEWFVLRERGGDSFSL
jgi:hypothetical protein